jgi:hypothetical protein
MSEETAEKVEQEKLTPEQMEANRKKVMAYYKKQIEVFELQAKYENLMAEIEVSRARRMEMIIRQAQMASGPETESDPDIKDPDVTGEKKERTLKKS